MDPADALRELEKAYAAGIKAWGKLAPRKDPAIYVVFCTPAQHKRLAETHAGADMPSPIEVRDPEYYEVARSAWTEETPDYATHGPSAERTVALIFPRR